jgi:hypothetical protein
MHYVTALNELSRLGVHMTRVEMLAVGDYRNYAGEVRAQEPAADEEIGPRTRIRLEIGAPSAVDMFPHQFFTGLEHRPDLGREWEESARRLMAPFDAAVIRHDAWSLYHILRMSFGYVERKHLERFLKIFEVPLPRVELTDEEMLLLSMLLPAYHDWGGNAESVAAAIELFFGFRMVQIEESLPGRYTIPEHLRYRLGSRTDGVGRGTLVGREFTEYESAYRITIRDVEPEVLPEMLPGRPLRRKFDWFIDFVMPSNLICSLRLEPRRRFTALGSGSQSHLGFGTFVGSTRSVVR